MKNLITAGALALAICTTTSLSLTTPSMAAEMGATYKAGDITILNPWARATPGRPRNGGAYLTIKGGASGDELTGVESAVAKKTQLHGHSNENGVMKMRQVKGIMVPAGGMAMLKPGGYHVMLMKLKHALKKGESFPLTLHFAKAGKVTVEVKIMSVGAMNAGENAGHGGHKDRSDHGDHGKMKMKK
jgi:hypothetical protein